MDCMVNFLRVPDSQENPVVGRGESEVTIRHASPEVVLQHKDIELKSASPLFGEEESKPDRKKE